MTTRSLIATGLISALAVAVTAGAAGFAAGVAVGRRQAAQQPKGMVSVEEMREAVAEAVEAKRVDVLRATTSKLLTMATYWRRKAS